MKLGARRHAGRLKRAVLGRLHPALVARLRRLRHRSRIDTTEQVSLIIPVYDVEAYVAQCLDSVIRQTYRNLQIIVVDDGSPDRSYTIVRSYARWDPRIAVVRQPNAGLGAARNTGLRHATGGYVGFVDSDDVLPRGAVRTLLASLQRSGSDFAVGGVERIDGAKRWTPAWATEVHRADRIGVLLPDAPDVLQDVFAWNKLFRREFFDRVVGQFPEGIRYEDQEPTARAYAAGRFDVLAAVVYRWRVRHDGTSITQQKANPQDLADRLEVKRRVAEVIRDQAPPVYGRWLAKAIGFDLRTYYDQVPRTDDAYWERLRTGVTALAEQLDDEAWTLVPILDRLPALAVAAGNRTALTRLLLQRGEYGWCHPSAMDHDGPFLDPDYLAGSDLDLPKPQLRLGERDLPLTSSLDGVRLRDDGVAEVTGRAYLFGLDLSRHSTQISAVLRCAADSREVPVDLQPGVDPVIDAEAGDSYNSYAAARFTACVDLSALPSYDFDAGEDRLPVWSLVVSVRTAGVVREGILLKRDMRGSAGQLPVPPVQPDGRRFWIGFANDRGLTFTATPRAVVGSDLRVSGTTVSLTLPTDDPRARLVATSQRPALRRLGAGVPLSDGSTRFELALSTPAPNAAGMAPNVSWGLALSTRGDPVRVSWAGRSLGPYQAVAVDRATPKSGVRFVVDGRGRLRVRQSPGWGQVDAVEASADGTELTVRGQFHVPLTWRVTCVLGAGQGVAGRIDLAEDGSFVARLPLVDTRWDRQAALPTGGRPFRLLAAAPEGAYERWLPVSPTLSARLPHDLRTPLHRVSLGITKRAKALWVTLRAPLPDADVGRLAQRRMHVASASASDLLDDVALFETFGGKAASDSPLALLPELRRRRPELTCYWAVRDHSVQVPDGARPVLLHSADYHRLSSSARYLVNNANFPFYFRKRPGQCYLQTWHGTPLKRIGNDVPSANLSLSYRELMRREADWWDALLAQNEFAADVFPRAFGYAGPVLDVGYPRNDALAGEDAPAARDRSRKVLGLAPEETAVLYAPTWRDNIRSSRGYEMVSYLDLAAAVTALGSTHRFLLRGHSNVAASVAVPPTGEVIDVTAHPDINELFLAADVLITDYSSVMFDFCLTGRPMLFLTPDLELYRGRTRGFYFDLEAEAPGPLLTDTAACVRSLADLDAVRTRYADRYAAFTARYAPRDDGRAAERVAEQLWPERA